MSVMYNIQSRVITARC